MGWWQGFPFGDTIAATPFSKDVSRDGPERFFFVAEGWALWPLRCPSWTRLADALRGGHPRLTCGPEGANTVGTATRHLMFRAVPRHGRSGRACAGALYSWGLFGIRVYVGSDI